MATQCNIVYDLTKKSLPLLLHIIRGQCLYEAHDSIEEVFDVNPCDEHYSDLILAGHHNCGIFSLS